MLSIPLLRPRDRVHLFLATALVVSLAPVGPAADTLYGRQIIRPESCGKDLQAALADLERCLSEMTGQAFTTGTAVGPAGIVIVLADQPDVPAAVRQTLAGQGREAFRLEPEGGGRLWVVANAEPGLCHGIYAYLDRLGCRWFFPSDRWRVVPRRGDVRLREAVSGSPAFVSRMFFGTGGFGGALPCDPGRGLQARWLDWQRRNRFGGSLLLAGHTGEAFNAKHRKELEEHPEYRALVGGQRVPYSAISKFCASNGAVLKLYVTDRLAALRQARKLDPDGPRSFAVSVEPADGGGPCECPDCLRLGSVSDRVFHVANGVARAVAEEIPGGRVSLYAYNDHAAVPSLRLEPNVYVAVIPYAFQRTGLAPEQLIDAWAQKMGRLSVYDYWSIPDWTQDLPTFDFLGAGPARLRDWRARGVEGFSCESTFSAGAMGPAWYVAGRLAWEPRADERAIFAEFLELAFGPACGPMRRLLERWADGFTLTSHELALSFRDVDEAWRLAESRPDVLARVADYGRYIEYLRRRFEYLLARGEDRDAATLRLLGHVWNVYDSAMIHSFRLSQLLTRDEGARRPELRSRYDPRDPKAPGWLAIRPLDDAGVGELVRAGTRDFTPAGFTTRRFSGPLVPLATTRPREGDSPVLFPASTQVLDVLAPAGLKQFRLRVGCEQPVRVTVTDGRGQVVHEQTVTTGPTWLEQWSELNVPLPGEGAYRVQLWSPKRTFRLSVPLGLAHRLPAFVNSQGRPTPRLYFYVPSGTDRLALYAPYVAAGPPRFFDPAGTEVKPELRDGGRLIILDVPASQRGAVWSLDRAKAPNEPIRLLNAPAAFAFSAEALLVPQDATRPTR